MIVLVAVGALIGPSVLGLVSNPLDGVGAQLLFNIGVALILFHGGVGISLRVISRTAVGLGMLVLPGIFITAFIVALVVAPIFGVSLLVAFMIGAVLASRRGDPRGGGARVLLERDFRRIRLPRRLRHGFDRGQHGMD